MFNNIKAIINKSINSPITDISNAMINKQFKLIHENNFHYMVIKLKQSKKIQLKCCGCEYFHCVKEQRFKTETESQIA